jgi:hypothetical protein
VDIFLVSSSRISFAGAELKSVKEPIYNGAFHKIATGKQAFVWSSNMTAKEFLDLSTKLFNDMKAWVAEASKDDSLSVSDLAMLNASMKIIERVTLKEAVTKPDTAN